MTPARILTRFALVAAAATALVTPLHAQQTDPLWRVINTQPAQVVPLYAGQESPWPAQALAPVVDMEEEEARRQANLALIQQAKDEIAAMIGWSNAFLPNVNGLSGDAYMRGAKGSMVLMGGRWYSDDTTFEVESFKNAAILSKINELSVLDSMAAAEMTSQFEAAHDARSRIRLKVVSIEPKQIVFEGPAGKITLPIRQSRL